MSNNVATVTIPVDEYFELRMKAEQHAELMRYFVETENRINDLWNEVGRLQQKIDQLRTK